MTTSIWPEQPIEFVPGQPYVYCKLWVRTAHLYVGSCYRGLLNYEGSPGRAIEAQIRAAHAAIVMAEESTMVILWTAPATRRQTTDMEMAKIAEFRVVYADRVVNRFPIHDWSGHMHWVHDRQTHIDHTVDFHSAHSPSDSHATWRGRVRTAGSYGTTLNLSAGRSWFASTGALSG